MKPNQLELMCAVSLLGLFAWIVAGINIWQAVRRKRTPSIAPLIKSVKVAWGLSMGAILVPYIAPFALIVAGLGFRNAKKAHSVAENKTALVLTLVNCLWAVLAVVFVLTYLLDLLRRMK